MNAAKQMCKRAFSSANKEKFIGAVDLGTTSTRFMIFDHAGTVRAKAQKEYSQITPQPGWCEQSPDEIWETTKEVVHEAMSALSVGVEDIEAVGLTNQRETCMVWSKSTGKPFHNAIVWHDGRTKEVADKLSEDGGQDRFRAKTGLPVSTYFSAAKVVWMLENVEGLREAMEADDVLFGTMDTWLMWNFTGGLSGGVHVTDVSNASRTLLMDLDTLGWDKSISQAMNIPSQLIMPEIKSSSEVYGYGSAGTGLEGVRFTSILGDQQAALFGQTCFSPGEAKNTYGTGCFMMMNTGTTPRPSTHGLLTTVGYKLGDQPCVYALEGSVAYAGALINWLRDQLCMLEDARQSEAIAAEVEDNGGVYVVPAFGGLLAPYWRSDARGVICGLTGYANRSHIVRAALESTCYQTRAVVEAMAADSGVDVTNLRVDGGMTVNQLMMQFQSDMLGVPVTRPQIGETTVLGAAYAAGLAVGYWSSLDELRQKWAVSQQWEPNMEDEKRQKLVRGWEKAVERSMGWEE